MSPDLGRSAEYIFAAELLSRGLCPCWPSTAMETFDIVVASHSRAVRVQVKATQRAGNSISVTTQMKASGKTRAYTSKDVDFLAIYLAAHKLWYVLPVSKVKGKGIYVRPEDPRCRYAKYKEAWSLLDQ